ncbi:MAG: tetratricopeptide repeat protein, partial [Candidatus Omnitrophica bacterium]|nr:tetratricopeptide repeat protein [Candidatus Omnitrophota bacterium]
MDKIEKLQRVRVERQTDAEKKEDSESTDDKREPVWDRIKNLAANARDAVLGPQLVTVTRVISSPEARVITSEDVNKMEALGKKVVIDGNAVSLESSGVTVNDKKQDVYKLRCEEDRIAEALIAGKFAEGFDRTRPIVYLSPDDDDEMVALRMKAVETMLEGGVLDNAEGLVFIYFDVKGAGVVTNGLPQAKAMIVRMSEDDERKDFERLLIGVMDTKDSEKTGLNKVLTALRKQDHGIVNVDGYNFGFATTGDNVTVVRYVDDPDEEVLLSGKDGFIERNFISKLGVIASLDGTIKFGNADAKTLMNTLMENGIVTRELLETRRASLSKGRVTRALQIGLRKLDLKLRAFFDNLFNRREKRQKLYDNIVWENIAVPTIFSEEDPDTILNNMKALRSRDEDERLNAAEDLVGLALKADKIDEFLEQYGKDVTEALKNTGIYKNELAKAYDTQGDKAKAARYYKQVIKSARKVKDENAENLAKLALARIYKDANYLTLRFGEAKKAWDKMTVAKYVLKAGLRASVMVGIGWILMSTLPGVIAGAVLPTMFKGVALSTLTAAHTLTSPYMLLFMSLVGPENMKKMFTKLTGFLSSKKALSRKGTSALAGILFLTTLLEASNSWAAVVPEIVGTVAGAVPGIMTTVAGFIAVSTLMNISMPEFIKNFVVKRFDLNTRAKKLAVSAAAKNEEAIAFLYGYDELKDVDAEIAALETQKTQKEQIDKMFAGLREKGAGADLGNILGGKEDGVKDIENKITELRKKAEQIKSGVEDNIKALRRAKHDKTNELFMALLASETGQLEKIAEDESRPDSVRAFVYQVLLKSMVLNDRKAEFEEKKEELEKQKGEVEEAAKEFSLDHEEIKPETEASFEKMAAITKKIQQHEEEIERLRSEDVLNEQIGEEASKYYDQIQIQEKKIEERKKQENNLIKGVERRIREKRNGFTQDSIRMAELRAEMKGKPSVAYSGELIKELNALEEKWKGYENDTRRLALIEMERENLEEEKLSEKELDVLESEFNTLLRGAPEDSKDLEKNVSRLLELHGKIKSAGNYNSLTDERTKLMEKWNIQPVKFGLFESIRLIPVRIRSALTRRKAGSLAKDKQRVALKGSKEIVKNAKKILEAKGQELEKQTEELKKERETLAGEVDVLVMASDEARTGIDEIKEARERSGIDAKLDKVNERLKENENMINDIEALEKLYEVKKDYFNAKTLELEGKYSEAVSLYEKYAKEVKGDKKESVIAGFALAECQEKAERHIDNRSGRAENYLGLTADLEKADKLITEIENLKKEKEIEGFWKPARFIDQEITEKFDELIPVLHAVTIAPFLEILTEYFTPGVSRKDKLAESISLYLDTTNYYRAKIDDLGINLSSDMEEAFNELENKAKQISVDIRAGVKPVVTSIKLLREALMLDSTNVEIRIKLARSLAKDDQLKTAVKHYFVVLNSAGKEADITDVHEGLIDIAKRDDLTKDTIKDLIDGIFSGDTALKGQYGKGVDIIRALHENKGIDATDVERHIQSNIASIKGKMPKEIEDTDLENMRKLALVKRIENSIKEKDESFDQRLKTAVETKDNMAKMEALTGLVNMYDLDSPEGMLALEVLLKEAGSIAVNTLKTDNNNLTPESSEIIGEMIRLITPTEERLVTRNIQEILFELEDNKKQVIQIILSDIVGSSSEFVEAPEDAKTNVLVDNSPNLTDDEKTELKIRLLHSEYILAPSVDIYIKIAELYTANKQPEKAGKFLEKAIVYDNSSVEAFAKLAENYYLRGMVEEALINTEEALRLDPSAKDAHLIQAFIFEDKNNLGDAIKSYKKVLGIDPENEKANEAIEKLYSITGTGRDDVDFYVTLSVRYLESGDYSAAIQSCLKALDHNPAASENFKELSDQEQEKLVAANTVQRGKIYRSLAQAYAGIGWDESAVSYAEKAAEIDEQPLPATESHARTLTEKGLNSEAVLEYFTVAEEYIASDKFDDAIRVYDIILKEDQFNKKAIKGRINACIAAGNLGKASTLIEEEMAKFDVSPQLTGEIMIYIEESIFLIENSLLDVDPAIIALMNDTMEYLRTDGFLDDRNAAIIGGKVASLRGMFDEDVDPSEIADHMLKIRENIKVIHAELVNVVGMNARDILVRQERRGDPKNLKTFQSEFEEHLSEVWTRMSKIEIALKRINPKFIEILSNVVTDLREKVGELPDVETKIDKLRQIIALEPEDLDTVEATRILADEIVADIKGNTSIDVMRIIGVTEYLGITDDILDFETLFELNISLAEAYGAKGELDKAKAHFDIAMNMDADEKLETDHFADIDTDSKKFVDNVREFQFAEKIAEKAEELVRLVEIRLMEDEVSVMDMVNSIVDLRDAARFYDEAVKTDTRLNYAAGKMNAKIALLMENIASGMETKKQELRNFYEKTRGVAVSGELLSSVELSMRKLDEQELSKKVSEIKVIVNELLNEGMTLLSESGRKDLEEETRRSLTGSAVNMHAAALYFVRLLESVEGSIDVDTGEKVKSLASKVKESGITALTIDMLRLEAEKLVVISRDLLAPTEVTEVPNNLKEFQEQVDEAEKDIEEVLKTVRVTDAEGIVHSVSDNMAARVKDIITKIPEDLKTSISLDMVYVFAVRHGDNDIARSELLGKFAAGKLFHKDMEEVSPLLEDIVFMAREYGDIGLEYIFRNIPKNLVAEDMAGVALRLRDVIGELPSIAGTSVTLDMLYHAVKTHSTVVGAKNAVLSQIVLDNVTSFHTCEDLARIADIYESPLETVIAKLQIKQNDGILRNISSQKAKIAADFITKMRELYGDEVFGELNLLQVLTVSVVTLDAVYDMSVFVVAMFDGTGIDQINFSRMITKIEKTGDKWDEISMFDRLNALHVSFAFTGELWNRVRKFLGSVKETEDIKVSAAVIELEELIGLLPDEIKPSEKEKLIGAVRETLSGNIIPDQVVTLRFADGRTQVVKGSGNVLDYVPDTIKKSEGFRKAIEEFGGVLPYELTYVVLEDGSVK